jgi:hypothetical protein
MRKVHEQKTSGIFDLKWSPQLQNNHPCLGQASADGSLSFYSLKVGDTATLEREADIAVSDAMCLSLDWRPTTAGDVSLTSLGRITLFVADSVRETFSRYLANCRVRSP